MLLRFQINYIGLSERTFKRVWQRALKKSFVCFFIPVGLKAINADCFMPIIKYHKVSLEWHFYKWGMFLALQ